eukprot:TRINITY_DN4860_c0_g1_i2.p1 TRINITY_DN4860_c0_g1~~TRINITY_DN4860_c0_g1_i2.p1  ORF type:complete len:252 (-),score=41.33 TRINITY_DN4860_c0_g1_i2:436-1191(-)
MAYESRNATHLSCEQDGCRWMGRPQAKVLPKLPPSVMAEAYRAARRVFGEVRGPPAISNVPFEIQDPVLHCTSDVVRKLIYLLLELLSEADEDTARVAIHEGESKMNILSLYSSEFRDLFAKLVACPDHLGVEVDPVLMQLFSLAQMLCASWRQAVGRGTANEREASPAVLELTATLLASLFAAIKPLDPKTGSRGAQNLALRTAAADARSRAGRNGPRAPLVSDDDIEGFIRLTNTYFKNRTGNVYAWRR